MTPVAALTALNAVSWDAALEETLSRAAIRHSATAVTGSVHSVHRRAANVLLGGLLVAVISAEFDDAPWTVRLSPADWARLTLHGGARATAGADGIRIRTADGEVLIRWAGGTPWMPASADLSALDSAELLLAREALGAAAAAPAPQTPFGRASAALLDAGVDGLRAAAGAALRGALDEDAIEAAVGRLMGLGEGLTPSGDDILTGFGFLAAQPGMRLNRMLPALTAGVAAHESRTTLLSATTIRAALSARGRHSMHDLVAALQARDPHALEDAAARILAIGHSSGADLLTGIRLALEIEAGAHETSSDPERGDGADPHASTKEGDHPMTDNSADQRYLEAASAGDLDGVRAALADGADKNALDREEATAILRAARGGHLDVVRALIAEGVDIDAQDQTCFNPFIHGCIFNDIELVKVMVEAGADLKRLTRFGGNGLTPAAEKGHLEIVRYLLENTNINVNLTNTLGWTALIETIILGDGGPIRQQTVELLLAHGAKPGMTDEWGVPPIELARKRGFDEIVAILERHQA